MVTGVWLSRSRGLGSHAGVDSGFVTSAATGLYPWIGYKASERVTLCTVAGYEAGGLLLNPGGGTAIETALHHYGRRHPHRGGAHRARADRQLRVGRRSAANRGVAAGPAGDPSSWKTWPRSPAATSIRRPAGSSPPAPPPWRWASPCATAATSSRSATRSRASSRSFQAGYPIGIEFDVVAFQPETVARKVRGVRRQPRPGRRHRAAGDAAVPRRADRAS